MITWFSEKQSTPSGNNKTSQNDFVSLSSHELRSPLSIVKWYTEILLDEDLGTLNETQKKYLGVIEASNERAIGLVRSLLNVSRLDLGTFSFSPEPLNLLTLLTEAKEEVGKLSKKNNPVVIHGDQSLVVDADKKALLLVFKILLHNAVIFSQEQKEVSVSCEYIQDPQTFGGRTVSQDSFVVSVHDYGIGIPAEDQSRIFEKMFRARNVKESENEGSGLGLYIAKTIMEHAGGALWFVSNQTGTSFFLSLPKTGMRKKEGKTTLD